GTGTIDFVNGNIDLGNYEVTVHEGQSTVNKAKLDVYVNGVNTTYGTKFDESKYGYTVGNVVNGDNENEV
ncbi:hypothetical protein, partial [Megamonas funiformis]|uniref:hypothetical protein n=1 Tax=Megamonas funiformis TaxID=437897 RepID=UPI0019597A0F